MGILFTYRLKNKHSLEIKNWNSLQSICFDITNSMPQQFLMARSKIILSSQVMVVLGFGLDITR